MSDETENELEPELDVNDEPVDPAVGDVEEPLDEHPTSEEPEVTEDVPVVDEPALEETPIELEPSPWEELWPTGATVRYVGTEPSIELPYQTDDGVLLRRVVEQGATLEVSPEMADSLAERADFEREA